MQGQGPRGAVQRYSVGNRVYGSGRSNPTSGTVDPSGYVERGFNNAASQRRSGLAQGALGRIGAGAPLPSVQNTDQRQALIDQNKSGQLPVGGSPFAITPEGHYMPVGTQQNNPAPLNLQDAIQRRLQGGLNGA